MELVKEYMDYAIFGILGLMSILSLTFAIERAIFYKRYKVRDYTNENELENDLTKNLTALSIIGSNAPYIGLLGTVVGVMVTFYDMGVSKGTFDTDSILIGLSLALKATAAGLLVAIPTLMIYTMCLRQVDVGIAKFKAGKDAS
ncbi:MAG: TonB-system energizer ExbB [Campylobacteraceae bacterium]|jgi:biopolymer transport protein ExbB|nr:TonB-system energizer ExbB [Campylobacteraceae bacterium]